MILESPWISGSRQYTASKGIITINSTFMTGADILGTLRIRAADGRQLSVSIDFSTLPCPDGELENDAGSGCFRCSANSYSFYPNASQCLVCEENAQCSGTPALVPKEGCWHSTPFSPFIRRCPVEKACSYNGRTENLTQYYVADLSKKLQWCNSSISVDLGNCSDSYQQCAPGYEGVLCGTCADGYGHSASGECCACSHTRTTSILFTLLSAGFLFAVLSIKICLASRDVDAHASELERQSRRQSAPNRGHRQEPRTSEKALTDATTLLVAVYNVSRECFLLTDGLECFLGTLQLPPTEYYRSFLGRKLDDTDEVSSRCWWYVPCD